MQAVAQACRHVFLNTAQPLNVLNSWTRAYSSITNPYPFPLHSNPTPQQIFHLPQNPSQEDIKSRYFELMRLYHPDSPSSAALPTDTCRKQYDAIRKAYDVLRGKGTLGVSDPTKPGRTEWASNLELEKWKAAQQRRADLHVGGVDEAWKDRLIMGAAILALAGMVVQVWDTRRRALGAGVQRFHHAPEQRSERQGSDIDALSATDTGKLKKT